MVGSSVLPLVGVGESYFCETGGGGDKKVSPVLMAAVWCCGQMTHTVKPNKLNELKTLVVTDNINIFKLF